MSRRPPRFEGTNTAELAVLRERDMERLLRRRASRCLTTRPESAVDGPNGNGEQNGTP